MVKTCGKKIRLTVRTGLSKFSGSRQVVGAVWKEVFLPRNLAHGTHYGSGMFCLTEAGEQQM